LNLEDLAVGEVLTDDGGQSRETDRRRGAIPTFAVDHLETPRRRQAVEPGAHQQRDDDAVLGNVGLEVGHRSPVEALPGVQW